VLIVCVCTILERLVDNVTTVGRADNVREASLEALGYICQDIVSSFIHSFIRVLLLLLFLLSFFSLNKKKTSVYKKIPLGFQCTCTSK